MLYEAGSTFTLTWVASPGFPPAATPLLTVTDAAGTVVHAMPAQITSRTLDPFVGVLCLTTPGEYLARWTTTVSGSPSIRARTLRVERTGFPP